MQINAQGKLLAEKPRRTSSCGELHTDEQCRSVACRITNKNINNVYKYNKNNRNGNAYILKDRQSSLESKAWRAVVFAGRLVGYCTASFRLVKRLFIRLIGRSVGPLVGRLVGWSVGQTVIRLFVRSVFFGHTTRCLYCVHGYWRRLDGLALFTLPYLLFMVLSPGVYFFCSNWIYCHICFVT